MVLSVLSSGIWLYLVFAHGRFWRSTPQLAPAVPSQAPDVDVVVPARDEAATIGRVIASLAAQDYAGRFRIFLIDDGSSDGTAARARAAVPAEMASRLRVVGGSAKPAGWSGKLWALSQGVALGEAPVILFADADIVHDPRHLATLVARLESPAVDLVSEMVRLECSSLAERALVPAFVYFFQMLYPFARVNDPRSGVAAAAGGTVLIRRAALDRIGGLASMRGALIDDVALAQSVKRNGPIFLGHSALAASIRPYPGFADIWNMIARTGFHATALLGTAPPCHLGRSRSPVVGADRRGIAGPRVAAMVRILLHSRSAVRASLRRSGAMAATSLGRSPCR